MEKMIVYQVTPEDLRTFLMDEIAKRDMNALRDALLKRYDNVFVGVSEVATIHQVTGQTVRNYINDGLINPELRMIENGKYHFRLSYVLQLDFEELRKQLRMRKWR